MLVGHGTASVRGVEEFMYYVRGLSNEMNRNVYYAFLEHADPTIEQSLKNMYKSGVRHIIVVPVFLFIGVHIVNDLPRIFDEFLKQHADARIQMLPYLYKADFLVPFYQAVLEQKCANQHLLMVGVGGSMKFTNDELVELSTSIVPDWTQSHLGFLSKVTKPHWLDILKVMHIEQQILICPIVLFYGRYIESIEAVVQELNAKGASIEIMPHIGKNDVLLNHLSMRIGKCLA